MGGTPFRRRLPDGSRNEGVGGGRGNSAAKIGGTLAGAAAGAAAENRLTQQAADEITIEIGDGEVVVVVQAKGRETFEPGDAVRVIWHGDGRARVVQ